ncbi:translational activator of GCN4 [Blyttiomyces sp. JEL0837]|nr:translational activator of GCN4 [Blyttiomyces sp. JEL0837]
MAFLAPKQLSLSLPQIVPRLCEVLADTHIKVQETAKQALNHFGQVIKNPEIQEHVPVLINALVDPNNKTLPALSALLETSFVHYIDSPSLALIVPILQRGLGERVTDIKKKGAQIMGQMSTLTDQKDLIPYLPTLMPGLKEVLVDQNPEARAIAARALGSMFEKLGEENFPGLVTELFQTLKSETSAVDRSGAAQGLSEVLAGSAVERMEGLLPEIVNNAMSPRTYVREGFITLLVYLPATFGERFQPYLASIIPPILRGLADETETVRETALKAGRVIVRNYATTAVEILLPELEEGLFDENWRIRQSSVQLMGDLLYKIAGISGKVEVDGNEDEGLGTEHSRRALIDTLGLERYNSVLASLYMVRSDSNAIVRTASLHVWKSIVSNTPRALKEILPVLITLVIESLASPEEEKRGVAARTLGDLVRKLGDLVLEEVVPILEKGLDSQDTDTRQGVCIGMSEIMATAGKNQVTEFVLEILPAVKKALMDSEPEVREAAAQAFDMLHQHLGNKAIDEVLPSLLNELKSGGDSHNSGYALEALKEIMSVRSNVVFPVLIPTLLHVPISSFNARALGSLISVAGSALNRRIATILPALLDGLDQQDSAVPDIKESLNILLSNIDEDGIHILMPTLTEYVKEGTSQRKQAACMSIAMFCQNDDVEFEDYANDWIGRLIEMMQGPPKYDEGVMKAAWGALEAVAKTVKKDEQEKFVTPVRRAITAACSNLGPSDVLPGFCLPKGISPVLPFFLQGLMYGSPDVRQESAAGLGDLVLRTTPDAIKPFVTQITGPLIRIIGDRFPPGVKAAILNALGLLLQKVPNLLKPFLPQLQRTFIKSLSEPVAQIRQPARKCLSLLIGQQTRLDPLVVELSTGIRTAEDRGGRDINDASKKAVETLCIESTLASGENDDGIRISSSKSFGALCGYLKPEESAAVLSNQIFKVAQDIPWYKFHGVVLCLLAVLNERPSVLEDSTFLETTVKYVCDAMKHEKAQLTEAGVKAAEKLLLQLELSENDRLSLLTELVAAAKPESSKTDARRMAVVAIKNVAKSKHSLAAERALVHVFCMSTASESSVTKPEVLQQYLTKLDASSARSIGDYARRVLTKIGEKDSDDEENMDA